MLQWKQVEGVALFIGDHCVLCSVPAVTWPVIACNIYWQLCLHNVFS